MEGRHWIRAVLSLPLRVKKSLPRAMTFLGLCTGLSSPILGHTMRQRIGVYEDSEGLERRRFGLDGTMTRSGWGALTQTSLGISMTRDQDRQQNIINDDYVRNEYGSGDRVYDEWSVQGNLTWDKLTETRLMAQGGGDGVMDRQTIGVGAGHWLYHETIRIAVDLSQTESRQPEFRILDFDSREIGTPPEGKSRGVSLGVRHLATPSTIMDYQVSQILQKGRPEARAAQIRVRQFLVPPPSLPSVAEEAPLRTTKTSVDLGIIRAVNKGALGTDTTYGEVDSLTMEAGVNIQLDQRVQSRLAYRFYKEQEVTRVLREEKLFGSDLVSLGLGYQFAKELSQGQERGYRGEIVVSRYQTNGGLLGRSIEAGLSALF